jgi:hypothetical protein
MKGFLAGGLRHAHHQKFFLSSLGLNAEGGKKGTKCGRTLRLTLKNAASVSAHTYGALRQGSTGLSCQQHRPAPPGLLTTDARATD